MTGRAPPDGGTPAAGGPSLRILVVDDDTVMCDSLAELLEGEGYHVGKANSVRRALEIMERVTPDLVLTDMKMPHASGLELLKDVRRLYPETYVVMITGYGTVDLAVEAMKVGAFDFIQKPFKSEQVLSAVRGVQEDRRFKEAVSANGGPPKRILEAEAASGSVCAVFTWEAPPLHRVKSATYVRFADKVEEHNGSIQGRDLFGLREKVAQISERGGRQVVLIEDVHRLLDHHAWPDVFACLEKILGMFRDGRGLLLVTADAGRLSRSQLDDLRQLLGERFVNEVIDSLSSPMRRASLLLAEKQPALFSDLMRACGTDSSPKLAFHLRKLVAEGLLLHSGERYAITDKGR
ncbi:MAG TPA: response regulator, partial [Thermoplasmata archaeon]|nr:response regulator [Thermoplasmata archaeon]